MIEATSIRPVDVQIARVEVSVVENGAPVASNVNISPKITTIPPGQSHEWSYFVPIPHGTVSAYGWATIWFYSESFPGFIFPQTTGFAGLEITPNACIADAS